MVNEVNRVNKVLCRVVSVGYELEPGQARFDNDGDEHLYRVRLLADADDPEGADVSILIGEESLPAFPLGGRVCVTVEPLDEANPVEREKVKFRRAREEADERESARVDAAYKAWREIGRPPGGPEARDLLGLLRDPENEVLLLSAFHLAEETAGGRPIG
jgi:hypothetical protein